MNNLINVSIIVPVFNASGFIRQTMMMLCASQLSNIEIIAINDGSTDNSLDILERCAAEDSRIRVVNKSNGGIFDARNRGLQEATGEYICFCDQDDFVEPQMYSRMSQVAKENNCDLVMCSTGKLIKGDQKVPDVILKDAVYENEEVIKQCFLPLIFSRTKTYTADQYQKISGTIWKCMVSREFLLNNQLKFRRYVSYEDDRLMLLDILARIKKVVLISDILYYWKVNLNSESHAPKYIEDLYNKDLGLQSEIVHIMNLAGCDEKDIRLFEKFNAAFRYTRVVENEAYHDERGRKNNLKEVNVLFEEQDFDGKIKYGKMFARNLFARRIVCIFLRTKRSCLPLDFYRFYISLRRTNQDRKLWVLLEQKSK